MTGARVCVATNEVGSTPIMFRSSDTLDAVAGRFHHDRSSNLLDVKTTAGGGLFIALPLNTELARLRDEGDLEGDGSGDNPFIVQVERAVMPELAGSAALAAAVQALSDNIAAMRVEVSDGLQQLAGSIEHVDMSAVSQDKATELLQTLGLQVTTLSLETAIQVEGLGDVLAALPNLKKESEAEFKMEQYPDEKAATLPFREHLKEQLRQLCGSHWNRWAVKDVRSKKLSWSVAGKMYTGYQDLGIFPVSASMDDLRQMRMGFELKHTDAHKQLHKKQAKAEAKRAAEQAKQAAEAEKRAAEAEKRARERQGPLGRSALAVAEQPVTEQPLRQSQRLAGRAATEPPSSQAVPGAQPHAVQACMSHMVNHIAPMNVITGVAWDERVRGQSILELLCNYRICEWPLDVVVTDGRTYHTLRLRGNDIQVVLDLSALDGLRLIAARLLQIDPSPTFSFKDNISKFPSEAVAAREAFRFIGSRATSSSLQQAGAASSSQQRAGAASSSQQQDGATSSSQQRAGAASSSQQQDAATSSSQQRAGAASSSQQRAGAASSSQQRADAVSRTVVMWEQIQELASLEAPEDRPALIEKFFQNNPERAYEAPTEIQAMLAF